jgi:hypothetical protein
MAITDLPRRIYSTDTGDLTDPANAAHVLSTLAPETGSAGPHLAILDLSGKLLSPASLRELIVPLGQGVRGGVYGDMKLVIVASDPAVLEQAALLAREHRLPIFLASSREPADVEEALPAGDLTQSERETLNYLQQLGGMATVSRLAEAMSLEANAATNRLVNVERKGYIHRIKRGRQVGDLFVDPRTRRQALVAGDLEREQSQAVTSPKAPSPFDRSPLNLQGEAARRAQEIIRHRR